MSDENGRLQCCACLTNIPRVKDGYPLDTPRVWNIFKDCTRIQEDVRLTGNQNLCAECYNTCTKWSNFYNMCQLNIPQTNPIPRPPPVGDIHSFPGDGKQPGAARNVSVQALEDLMPVVQQNHSILLDSVLPMLTFVATQLGYEAKEVREKKYPIPSQSQAEALDNLLKEESPRSARERSETPERRRRKEKRKRVRSAESAQPRRKTGARHERLSDGQKLRIMDYIGDNLVRIQKGRSSKKSRCQITEELVRKLREVANVDDTIDSEVVKNFARNYWQNGIPKKLLRCTAIYRQSAR